MTQGIVCGIKSVTCRLTLTTEVPSCSDLGFPKDNWVVQGVVDAIKSVAALRRQLGGFDVVGVLDANSTDQGIDAGINGEAILRGLDGVDAAAGAANLSSVSYRPREAKLRG